MTIKIWKKMVDFEEEQIMISMGSQMQICESLKKKDVSQDVCWRKDCVLERKSHVWK